MSTIKIMAVGDISLQTRSDINPFVNIKNLLSAKNVLFGNLEVVLSETGPEKEKSVLLRSAPEKVAFLKNAGFDVLNLANNHIMDLGAEGFHNTLRTLRKEGLSFIGANDEPGLQYIGLARQGIKLGFLGYRQGGICRAEDKVWINRIKLDDIIQDINESKPLCDFIVISLHWGIENVHYPSPKQIDIAHNLVDAGASLILGHHPHVIQGIERYKDGLIAYSLGNFQFAPSRLSSGLANSSMILSVEFSRAKIENHRIIPVIIDDDYIPRPGNKEVVDFVNKISQPIKSGTITEKWWFEQIASQYLSGNINSYITRMKKYGAKHFLQFIIWLISPFRLKCYMAIARKKCKK